MYRSVIKQHCMFIIVVCTVLQGTAAFSRNDNTFQFRIGGMYQMHNTQTNIRICDGDANYVDIVLVDAHYLAVSLVNQHVLNGTGIKLNSTIMDSCNSAIYGLQQSVAFLQDADTGICEERTNSDILDDSRIFAVTGTMISSVVKPVTTLLGAFCVPLLAEGATSTEFDDETAFPYLLRLLPSDRYQAEAIHILLMRMGWTLVSIVYESSTYGTHLKEAFAEIVAAGNSSICIEQEQFLYVEKKNEWGPILKNIENGKAKVVVMFVVFNMATDFFNEAAKRGWQKNQYQFVGTEGWSIQLQHYDSAAEQIIENSITTDPSADVWEAFDDHLSNVTIDAALHRNDLPINKDLAFLIAAQRNCTMDYVKNNNYHSIDFAAGNPCVGNETIRIIQSAMHRARLTYVAIFTIGKTILQYCKSQVSDLSKCPDIMKNLTGDEMMNLMSKIVIDDQGYHFQYRNSTGPARYAIFQFQNTTSGHEWKLIGNYSNEYGNGSVLQLSTEAMKNETHVIIGASIRNCSKLCNNHEYPVKIAQCCNLCQECFGDFQYFASVKNESQCEECPMGQAPLPPHYNCTESLVDCNSDAVAYYAIPSIFSFFGMLFTIACCTVFYFKCSSRLVDSKSFKLIVFLTCLICVGFVLWPFGLLDFHPAFCVMSWGFPALFLTAIMACIYCEMVLYRKRHEHLLSSCEIECISLRTYIVIFVVSEIIIVVMWFALRPAKIIFGQLRDTDGNPAYVKFCAADNEWETVSVFVGPLLSLIYVMRSLYIIIKKIGWADLPDHKNRRMISWEVRLKLIAVMLLLALNVLMIPLMINANEIGLQCQRARLVYIVWSELNAFIPLACLLLPDAYVILFKSQQYE